MSARSRPPIVVVSWDDACELAEDDTRDIDEPFRVTTVGWLVEDKPRAIKVACERLPDGRWRGITRIPRACVLRVQVVRK